MGERKVESRIQHDSIPNRSIKKKHERDLVKKEREFSFLRTCQKACRGLKRPFTRSVTHVRKFLPPAAADVPEIGQLCTRLCSSNLPERDFTIKFIYSNSFDYLYLTESNSNPLTEQFLWSTRNLILLIAKNVHRRVDAFKNPRLFNRTCKLPYTLHRLS